MAIGETSHESYIEEVFALSAYLIQLLFSLSIPIFVRLKTEFGLSSHEKELFEIWN